MTSRHEVAVIGAGFGGLALAHRLAEDGIDDVVILERSDGVGGTWRANTYPGAACDVPSHLYSLSFAPNPNWSRAYASQPEILQYVEDCYDRFDVRRKVRTGVEVVSAAWSEADACWRVHASGGDVYEARVLVSAIGLFHTPSIPVIEGADDFAGRAFHSARWDHGHDLTGRRVAVVGTGASAIQIVPAIAEQTAHVDVYQRTAPWILPRRDEPYSDEEKQRFADDPAEARAHRQGLHDLFEQTTAFVTGHPAVELLEGVASGYLEKKVTDPDLRAALTPGQRFGCQRTLVSSDWYPTMARDDVDLVTTPIERITPDGIRTVDGVERPVDTIVWCTGFRASDYLRGIEVVGRGGATLQERWAGRPRAFHGIAVPEFPNLFLMYGPNTNQGGNSILLILEAQAEFIARSLRAVQDARGSWIEVREDAMARYSADLEAAMATTVWAGDCASYFHGPSGDIVTQLPHTSSWYARATAAIDLADFTVGGVTCTTS